MALNCAEGQTEPSVRSSRGLLVTCSQNSSSSLVLGQEFVAFVVLLFKFKFEGGEVCLCVCERECVLTFYLILSPGIIK